MAWSHAVPITARPIAIITPRTVSTTGERLRTGDMPVPAHPLEGVDRGLGVERLLRLGGVVIGDGGGVGGQGQGLLGGHGVCSSTARPRGVMAYMRYCG